MEQSQDSDSDSFHSVGGSEYGSPMKHEQIDANQSEPVFTGFDQAIKQEQLDDARPSNSRERFDTAPSEEDTPSSQIFTRHNPRPKRNVSEIKRYGYTKLGGD